MAILTTREIRKMSVEERKEKMRDLQIQLIKFRSKVNTGGEIESPGKIRELRRAIARIKTIDHEEKLQINTSSQ